VDEAHKMPFEGGNGHHHGLPAFKTPGGYFLKVEFVKHQKERARVFQKRCELAGHEKGVLLKVSLVTSNVRDSRLHGDISVLK